MLTFLVSCCVFLIRWHFSLQSTRRCLDTLGQVIESQCMDASADVLQVAMFGTKEPTRPCGGVAEAGGWKAELRPRQSSSVHNGITLEESSGQEDSVTYALFHPQVRA